MASPERHTSARPPTAPPTIAPILVVAPELLVWDSGCELPGADSAPLGMLDCPGPAVMAGPVMVELVDDGVGVGVVVDEVVVMKSSGSESVVKAE